MTLRQSAKDNCATAPAQSLKEKKRNKKKKIKAPAAANSVAADASTPTTNKNMEGTSKSSTNSVENLLNSIDSCSEMSEDVEKLLALKPVLERLHELLLSDQNNIITKLLSLETEQQRWDEKKRILIATLDSILQAINSINTHIDEVMKDAPKKLKVTVSVSDADKKAIQAMFDKHLADIKEEKEKQLQQAREEYDRWSTNQYARENNFRSEIHDMLNRSEGFYVSGIWYYVHLSFFLTGIVATGGLIISGILKAVG